MQVFVDEHPVIIFSGCTAVDAVRRLSADLGSPIVYTALYDAWGNEIAPDSPMNDGRHIFTSKPTTR